MNCSGFMSGTSCSGCAPVYQENQQAHMEPGGCLYCSEVDGEGECQDEPVELFCLPVNLEPAFDASVKSDSSSNFSEFDSSSVGVECCICYETIGKTNNCVTECGHAFCFKCLMSAMSYNAVCPYCRADLVDKKEGDEEAEDNNSEYESDEEDDDDDDDDDDEENIQIDKGNMEEVVARLVAKGVTMLDVVSVLFNTYSKTDDKYTIGYIDNLTAELDIVNMDVQNESDELENMAMEDIRV